MAKFEEALQAMREGKKVQKGVCIYRLDVRDDGRYNIVMEYPIGNLSTNDIVSEGWEVIDDTL